MIISKLRFLFVALLLLVGTHTALYAQSTLGVVWDIPSDADSAHTQLQQFHKTGISILEIDHPPAPEIWDQIDSLGFTVYGNLDINFPVTYTFTQADSSLLTFIENSVSTYLSEPSVKAIGLFNYGNIWQPTFWKAVAPYANKINQAQNIALYHKTNTSSQTNPLYISFPIINVPVTATNYNSMAAPLGKGPYLYDPSTELRSMLKPFKKFTKAVSQSEKNTIFVKSGWLLMMIEKHPQFSETLLSLSSDSEPIFPLPNEKIPSPSNTILPIVLLLFIWGTIAIHYNTSPLYRKSLFRYFTAHKFFIDDIFQRFIRSPMPAAIIILQNALLLSISSYVLFSVLLSPMGQQAFFYHFAGVAIAGDNPSSIFVWTFAIVLLLSLISITWLYFSHKKIRSFTQIATVYAWPLQLNFLFCTAVITFSYSVGSQYITFFTAFALLLFLSSYIFAAMDVSRFAKFKIKHLFKTIIPYSLIIIGLLGWFFTHDHWTEVLSLALNLT